MLAVIFEDSDAKDGGVLCVSRINHGEAYGLRHLWNVIIRLKPVSTLPTGQRIGCGLPAVILEDSDAKDRGVL